MRKADQLQHKKRALLRKTSKRYGARKKRPNRPKLGLGPAGARLPETWRPKR